MRFNKISTRFLSVLMALVMCFSLSATAFAMDVMPDVEDTENLSDTQKVSPRTVVTLLTLDCRTTGYNGSKSYAVTPAKGTNLKLIINNNIDYHGVSMSSEIKVEVTKEGGWWPSTTLNIAAGTSSATYDLIENCNGGTYTIKISGSSCFYYGYVVQTEYT